MSKAIVHIMVPETAKELRCGDYMDFYIAQICDVELHVEDENGDTLYEDDEYQLCPTYSICGYQGALENPDDEDNKECVEDFKNTRFESCSFLKTVWEQQPLSEPEFCRQLVMEATEHDSDVEVELSAGEDRDEPLYVTFEINLPNGEFDVDKLSFINFDMEEGDMECAEIIDNAFTGCDKVLLNYLKYEDTFYPNSGDDDGFSEGCNTEATATVDCDTLEEI